MPALFGALIARDKAKLWELREKYSLEDAYIMFESLLVVQENEARLQDYYTKTSGKK